MNLALLELEGYQLRLDPLADVNETAAIVYSAKALGMKSAVFILGGGSPKNFILQTEPQIQEVMGVAEKGPRLFPAGNRRASRYRRTFWRDAQRSGELG